MSTKLKAMNATTNDELEQRVTAIRAFNRFYTQQIGVLHESLAKSPFSLTEARVLYELAQRAESTAAELGNRLGLDPGYLSRILSGFVKRGLVDRKPSRDDARQSNLSLTGQGAKQFGKLNLGSQTDTKRLIAGLAPAEQRQLIGAMQSIQRLLGSTTEADRSLVLRGHRPGDIGWIVQQHGIIYAQEYGWNEEFEGLVAGIVADFLRAHDPKRECCWIAEHRGENAGCVFLVAKTKRIAQLRLLLVQPRARGFGIGDRLVNECIRFAHYAGYQKIVLWTNNVLVAARRLYEKAGFVLTAQEPHESFGVKLIGETWELGLSSRPEK